MQKDNIISFKDFLMEKSLLYRVQEERRGNKNIGDSAINSIIISLNLNKNNIKNKKLKDYIEKVIKYLEKY